MAWHPWQCSIERQVAAAIVVVVAAVEVVVAIVAAAVVAAMEHVQAVARRMLEYSRPDC